MSPFILSVRMAEGDWYWRYSAAPRVVRYGETRTSLGDSDQPRFVGSSLHFAHRRVVAFVPRFPVAGSTQQTAQSGIARIGYFRASRSMSRFFAAISFA